MPSFSDPHADAEEMWQAARGLAHATRDINRPEELYDVFGSVTATLRALTQSLEQVGRWHLAHTDRARHDDGDFAAGADDARATAFLALQAAGILDQATDTVMAAHAAAGRIAWEPDGEAVVRGALTGRETALSGEPDSPRRGPDRPGSSGRALS